MRISTEAWLMLVVVGLYLFDASMFFETNEAALLRAGRSRWFAAFGLDRWRLGGKEPYLPNPFTPFRPLFRLKWRFESPAPEWVAPDSSTATMPITPTLADLVVPKELNAFTAHVSISAVLLFVVLPVALFAPMGVAFVVAVVSALYVNNLWALLKLYRHRAAFQLDRKTVAPLMFECLACPPFSVNLVRKLCAKLAVTEDLVAAGAQLMTPAAYALLRSQCLRRIDEQIEGESEGTPRMRALLSSRPSYAVGNVNANDHGTEAEAEAEPAAATQTETRGE